jgi:hypothetical protein
MIKNLRAFFLARHLREKLLLFAFALAAAAIWLSSLSGRAGRFIRGVRTTTDTLAEQATWLSNRALVDKAAADAASRLEPARTLDTTRLIAEVSAIASEAGLTNTTSGDPNDLRSGQFAVHTLRFNVSKVDWASLKAFYVALGKRSPYIGIEQCTIQVDRANPAQLTASFQISSVEVSRN